MDLWKSHTGRPVGLFLGVATLVGVVFALFFRVPTKEDLSNAQLLAEYEAGGIATDNTSAKLMDSGGYAYRGMPNERLQDAQAEILRRKEKIVPALTAFLEKEAPKERQPEKSGGSGLSLTHDVLDLLVEIGDPRCVPVVMRILEGWDGKVNPQERSAALSAMEKLTMVCFHEVRPDMMVSRFSLQNPEALAGTGFSEFDTPARLYRKWLEGEGKNPSAWTDIARSRAREQLTSKDLDAVYCAAAFLRPEKGRDDSPDVTLARLMEVVRQMKLDPDSGKYLIDGQPVPRSHQGWLEMVMDYGPRAQIYSAELLRFQKESKQPDPWGLQELRKVGGREILAYFFEVLPGISAQADEIRRKAGGDRMVTSDDRGHDLLIAQKQLRMGIDRWAGRTFDSDADRQAWWEANKTKSPREWIEAGLAVIPGQLDERKKFTQWIAFEVLPDLPGNSFEISNRFYSRKASPPLGGAFVTAWLATHRPALRYDENAGCFRLKP